MIAAKPVTINILIKLISILVRLLNSIISSPIINEAEIILNIFRKINFKLNSLITLFRLKSNNIEVIINELEVAIAIPKIPNIFDKLRLRIIFIVTPIIPFIVVSTVLFIAKRVELSISLKP
jgi:hypothetical protein